MNRERKNSVINRKLRRKITLEYLKNDLEIALPSFQLKNDRIKSYVDTYDNKNNVYSNPNTILNIKEKSQYKSFLFKKSVGKIVPRLETPVLFPTNLFNLSLVGETSLNSDEVSVASDLLNHQWNSLIGKRKLVNKASRKFAIEGTCILKVGWDINIEKEHIEYTEVEYAQSEQEEREAFQKAEKLRDGTLEQLIDFKEKHNKVPIGTTVKAGYKNIIKRNQPQVKVVDNLAVIIDPYCDGDLKNANFLIEMYEVSYSILKQNESRYFNLDKLAKQLEDTTISYEPEMRDIYRDTEYAQEQSISNRSYISDKNKNKLMMYEYWGYVDIDGDGKITPIVASWVNDTIVRLEVNPYPHGSIPYCISNYEPLSSSIFGESTASTVKYDQDGLTLTHRSMQNITVKNSEQQDFINSKFLPDILQRKNYREGKTVYYSGAGNIDPRIGIYTKTADAVPDVLFQMKDVYENPTFNPLSWGTRQDGNFITDAFGVSVPTDGTDDEELSIVGRFISLFEDMANLINPLNAKYSFETDAYVDRFGDWRKIHNLARITGAFLVSTNVSTPEIQARKASRIMGVMNSRSANTTENTAALHYARISELLDEKVLGKMILDETINKEPSEQEQKMMELEVQEREAIIDKIMSEATKYKAEAHTGEARYEDLLTKAMERIALLESDNAEAVAAVNRAKAFNYEKEGEKLVAQTEVFNEELNYKATGKAREDKEIDAQFQHLANLEREDKRTERELTLQERKADTNKDGKVSREENKNYLLDLIRDGTLENDSYDEMGHVYRNIDKLNYNEEQ